MKNNKIITITTLLILALVVAVGCNKTTEQKPVQVTELKIGVLPTEDTIPFLVAEQKGFFAEENVKVELVPFQSAMEKDSALQSGQLDGVIADLIVAALLKDSGSDIKITSLTTGVTPGEGRFAILTAPSKNIKSLEELKGKKIAVSTNTIIEYVTDGILLQGGIDPSEVEKVLVPKLPVRLEMLLSGQVEAAVLPDPLAAFAEFNGATVFGDNTSGKNLSQVVLVMNNKNLQEKAEAMKGFYKAFGKAVNEYNADAEKYRSLVIEHAKVPEPIKNQYAMPKFSSPQLPQEKEVNEVLKWMQDKGLLKNNTTYDSLVEKGLY